MLGPSLDPDAPFAELLGRLVELLRAPREDLHAIEEVVAGLARRSTQGPALIEAGIENSWAVDGDPLKARLQARRVDTIRVAQGTSGPELLALGRALADDEAPLPSTAGVRVQLVPDPLPAQATDQRPAIRGSGDQSGIPRARPGDQLAAMIEGILHELEKAIRREQWHAVLHAAQAALRAIPGLQEDVRRGYTIALKRLLPPEIRNTLIEQAYRVPEERERTAEVLRIGGGQAAEQMLEIIRRSDTIGPRAFLVDSIAGIPEALPILVPLLKGAHPVEARLAAELLGRLGVREAVPHLVAQAKHPDERVRLAVLEALGRYRDKAVVEPLRSALGHDSPATRAQAGRALSARGSAAMAMPLLAALEAEHDAEAWESLLASLAAIDAPETASALLGIALGKAGLLQRKSTLERRQLAVVRALAASGTRMARQALQKIALEGQGKVREAAEAALGK